MASSFVPNVWAWINSLPTFSQWRTNSMSICICTSSSSKQPSMNLSITKTPSEQPSYITISIVADFHEQISLWTSSPISLTMKNQQSLNQEDLIQLFVDIVTCVLRYGPSKKATFRFPTIQIRENFKDVFNLALLTLVFLVCVYEAPYHLRQSCVNTLRVQLTSSNAKEASMYLVRILGSNLEDQWMSALNLGVTNWIAEIQSSNPSYRTPSMLFSYALSASGLWKVQLYCPVIAMPMEESPSIAQDERLMFSLRYQQVECVIQLAYKAIFKENWIDLVINVDNIRCDVHSLVSETLMAERGYGSEEKHFPSRISLQITPMQQSDILSVSVAKSSENPIHELGLEKTIEGAFDPPNSYLGLKIASTETITTNMKPWKFEQSVHGNSAILDWFLHDGVNGREVFSSKPSKFALFQPRAWFKDRYKNAYRPFTRQGGVIFAGDEYGESVWWKLCGGAVSAAVQDMQWEIKGWIWLTYWPNKQRSFYSETRWLEFRECLSLHLPKVG